MIDFCITNQHIKRIYCLYSKLRGDQISFTTGSQKHPEVPEENIVYN